VGFPKTKTPASQPASGVMMAAISSARSNAMPGGGKFRVSLEFPLTLDQFVLDPV
jgi:hypothetical protein